MTVLDKVYKKISSFDLSESLKLDWVPDMFVISEWSMQAIISSKLSNTYVFNFSLWLIIDGIPCRKVG